MGIKHILAFNGGTMKPSEIADWTFRERHNVTTLTRRLERDGLVKIKQNERDKRFVDISLTDKGRQVLAKTTPVAQEIVNHVMLSISESDAVRLEQMLEVMRRNVHDGLEGFTK
ncbi:MarR family winged helix-turn-helix transcriptional regulator [Chloroflexota bacterium]